MTPSDLASQFELYAQSNETAYKGGMGDATPDTELYRLRHVYNRWRLERAHSMRQAAEMVREYLVPRWTSDCPTEEGYYWHRLGGSAGKPTVRRVYRGVKGELMLENAGFPIALSTLDEINLWLGPLSEPSIP